MGTEQRKFEIVIGKTHDYDSTSENQFTSTDYSIVDTKGAVVVWGSLQKAKDHDILYSVVWNAQETIDRFLESVDSTLRALETSDAVSQADPEITPGYMVEYGRKRLRDIPLEQPFPKNFKKRFPDFPDHGVRFVRVDTALADFVFHDRGQLEEPDSLPQIGLITIINAPDQLADFILGNHDLKLPRPLVISLLDKLGSIVRTKSLSSK